MFILRSANMRREVNIRSLSESRICANTENVEPELRGNWVFFKKKKTKQKLINLKKGCSVKYVSETEVSRTQSVTMETDWTKTGWEQL